MNITLDKENQLYIVSTKNSFSSLGFDVVYSAVCEMVARLSKAGKFFALPLLHEKGSISQFNQYLALCKEYALIDDKEVWFQGDVSFKLKRILTEIIKTRTPVRLHYGDRATGCDWLEEFDIKGIISTSGPPQRIPILLPRSNSTGGSAVLVDCIVRIVDKKGNLLYQHPNYHTPSFKLEEIEGRWGVFIANENDGSYRLHDSFDKELAARKWLKKMNLIC